MFADYWNLRPPELNARHYGCQRPWRAALHFRNPGKSAYAAVTKGPLVSLPWGQGRWYRRVVR